VHIHKKDNIEDPIQFLYNILYFTFKKAPASFREENIIKDIQALRSNFFIDCRCTVKSPSQSSMTTLINKCKSANKPLVVAGCVPQGSKDLKELEGVSVIGVQQIDRVVEVVEETLKGHEVRLFSRRTLPSLDLPKVFFKIQLGNKSLFL
jgi:tRNA A37 methylthiotransferase MiaB